MRQDDVPTDYAKRVRELRGKLTQTELAKRLGVSFVSVNRWENNKHAPTPLAWQQILRFEKRQRGRP